MEKSSLNRNLKRLLQQQLLEMNSKEISLSEKGKYLLEKIIPEWQKAKKEVSNKIQNEGQNAINTLFYNLNQ